MDSFLVILGIALYIVFFAAKKKKGHATPAMKRPAAEPVEFPPQQDDAPYPPMDEEMPQPAPPAPKEIRKDAPPQPPKEQGKSIGQALKKDLRKAIIYSEIIKRKY